MLIFNYMDLWRSEYWYRIDGYWGLRHSKNMWRNDTGWKFNYGSGIHLGGHIPNYMEVPEVSYSVNFKSVNEIVVLHYGMSSYELLCRKLDYQIATSAAIKTRANGVPIQMPHPSNWLNCNGYKVADERGLVLRQVEQRWFKNPLVMQPKPKFKSLYEVVVKYNKPMAEEYAKIYGR